MGSAPLHIRTPTVVDSHLRVDWQVIGDRWHHSIWLGNSRNELLLLKSVEGAPDQDWPVSAPIQECHRQTLDSGPAMFGVGMAGSSHWSVVVEMTDNALQFDYACRVRTVPDFLGNAYRHHIGLSEVGPGRFCVDDPIPLLRIACVEVADHDDHSTAELLKVDDEQLQIHTPIQDSTERKTYRWRYRIGLESKLADA